MRVLIIAHDVGSKDMGMVFRPYYVAQGLKARGHDVDVITATYSRVRIQNPVGKGDLDTDIIEGIPYHWLKSLPFTSNSVRRAIGMFLFSFKLWWYAYFFSKNFRPQVVIASSPHPFIIWGAKRIATVSKAKLIFEVRDIWPLTMSEMSGMSKFHPFYVLCQKAEDDAYRFSDKVVSLLPYAYEHMQTRGLSKEKFVCIPNGFTENYFRESKELPKEHAEKITEFRKKFDFIVGYAGAHGFANSLANLIQAFNILSKDQNVGLILIGDGAEKKSIENLVQKLRLSNVLMLSAVSKEQVLNVIGVFDAAYIGLKKSPLFKYGVSPNKLIDYMMLAKPVLYAIDTERDPVLESQCGIKVPADSPLQISQGIQILMKLPKDEMEKMGKRGQEWVIENLGYESLMNRWEEIL